MVTQSIPAAALAVLCTLSLPAVAAASQEDDAKRAFAEGKQDFARGEYEKAIAHFQQADAILPSPTLTYNIGTCLERLGRFGEAADAFERYLSESGPPPDDEEKEFQDNLRARIEANRTRQKAAAPTPPPAQTAAPAPAPAPAPTRTPRPYRPGGRPGRSVYGAARHAPQPMYPPPTGGPRNGPEPYVPPPQAGPHNGPPPPGYGQPPPITAPAPAPIIVPPPTREQRIAKLRSKRGGAVAAIIVGGSFFIAGSALLGFGAADLAVDCKDQYGVGSCGIAPYLEVILGALFFTVGTPIWISGAVQTASTTREINRLLKEEPDKGTPPGTKPTAFMLQLPTLRF